MKNTSPADIDHAGPMTHISSHAVLVRLGGLFLGFALCAGMTGCFGFLKPAEATARHFVLTSLPATESPAPEQNSMAVGLGQVKLPPYLFNTSLAVRKGTNEIDYLTSALWAERLDIGLQRVLAANLTALLPTDRIRVSAWQKEDVGVELYVVIEQFEVDASGQGILVARWRVLSPGGDKVLKAGRSRFTRAGPPPERDPSGSVTTLSDLVGELSQQLAKILSEAATSDARPISSAGSTP